MTNLSTTAFIQRNHETSKQPLFPHHHLEMLVGWVLYKKM